MTKAFFFAVPAIALFAFSSRFWTTDVKNVENIEKNAAPTSQTMTDFVPTIATDETDVLPKIDTNSLFQRLFFNYYEWSVEENPSIFIPTATGFDYPFGPKAAYTQRNDGDGWYNRQDFRVNNHMGEDWNKEGGSAADCGEPILAAAEGLVVYAAPADKSWGNVIILRHKLPNGEQVETFYAHVSSKDMIPYLSKVKRRQMIGRVGDGADPCGDGRPYGAHLHFEVRTPRYHAWGNIGHGYDSSTMAVGAIDPSNYIDSHRTLK